MVVGPRSQPSWLHCLVAAFLLTGMLAAIEPAQAQGQLDPVLEDFDKYAVNTAMSGTDYLTGSAIVVACPGFMSGHAGDKCAKTQANAGHLTLDLRPDLRGPNILVLEFDLGWSTGGGFNPRMIASSSAGPIFHFAFNAGGISAFPNWGCSGGASPISGEDQNLGHHARLEFFLDSSDLITDFAFYLNGGLIRTGGGAKCAALGVFSGFRDGANTGSTVYYDNLVIENAIRWPGAPQDVNVDVDSQGTGLVLSWAAPANPGASPITHYRVYAGDSPGAQAWLADVTGSLSFTEVVGYSKTRHYRVSAVNDVGEGPSSQVVSGTTPDPVPPGAPRDPSTAPGPAPGGIAVTWKPPLANNGPRVTSYSVYRSESPSGPFTWVGDAAAPRLVFEDTGRASGTTSYYQVKAWNVQGEGPASPTVAGRPDGVPGAPRVLEAIANGASDLLTWRAPLGDGGLPITGYTVYASEDGQVEEAGTTAGLSLAVPACPGCTYWVTASNAAGEGLPSNLAGTSAAFVPWPQEAIRGTTPGAGTGLAPIHACGESGGSVNLATGQFVSSVCLMHVESPLGLDLDVVATHRTHGPVSSVLGQGWDLSLLRRLDADGQDILLLDGQGREDRFTWSALAGDYVSPPGLYADLDRLPSGAHELRHPGGLVEAFAADGRRTEVRDAVGNDVDFRYDLQGRPLEVRDLMGRSVTFQYGPLGLAAVNDGARTTALTVDEAGDLTEVSALAGQPSLRHAFTYTSRHDLATATDPDGRTYLENHYDPLGRVDGQRGGVGNLTFTHDPVRSNTTVTDGLGSVVFWEYDARTVATRKVELTNRDVSGDQLPAYVTTFEANVHGELERTAWTGGRSAIWDYDESDADPRARGNLESYSELASDGSPAKEWTSTYETAYQLPREVTAPLGNADGYVPPNGGANSAARHTTTFWYGQDEAAEGDLNGDGTIGGAPSRVVAIELPEANPAGAAHPSMGSAQQERLQLYAYNARGQVVRATAPDGAETLYDYYEAGEAMVSRPLYHLQAFQRVLQPGAAALAPPLEDTSGLVPVPLPPSPGLPGLPGPDPVETLQGLLGGPAPTASSFAAEDGPIDSFEYDDAGNVVLAVDPLGRSTTWSYDDLGRVTQARAESQGFGKDYEYDGRGNLVAVATLNSRQAEDGTYVVDASRPALVDRFSYDVAGNLVERRLNATAPAGAPQDSVEQFAYDAAGRMVLHRRPDAVTGADPDAVTTYLHDERGNVVATTEGGYTDAFAQHAGDVGAGLGLAGVSKTRTLYLHAGFEAVASCPANEDLQLHQSCRQAPAGDCPGGANGTVVNARGVCKPPLRYPVAQDGVVHVGDLPAARQGSSAVWDPARGLAYVLGGVGATFASQDDIIAYDPQTEEARVVAHLPSPRWFGAAVFDGTHVYYFGGCPTACGSTSGSSEIVRFDPVTKAVAVVGNLPTTLHGHAAIWDGSKAYIFGGCTGTGASCVTKDIVSFDPATGQVATLPGKLPKANYRMPAVWTGEKAFLFGGTGTDGFYVDVFDPLTGIAEHVTTTQLPRATSESSAAWDGQFAYVFGGLHPSGGGSTAAILRYDPAEDELVTMTQALPAPTIRSAAVWTTDSALVIGGGITHPDSGTSTSNRIQQYKPVVQEPTEPHGLLAVPGPAPGQTTLRWQAPDSTGSTSLVAYHVHESPQSGGPYTLAGTAPAPQRHLVVPAGPTGQTTYYVVSAENGDLEGPTSQEANVVNTPVIVEAPITLCPGEQVGIVAGPQALCPASTACPPGTVGGVAPATVTSPPVPVCVAVFGCPAGTAGVIANDEPQCQPVPSVCLPVTACPSPGDVVCYLPSCLHIVPGILAAHLSPAGIGVQADLSSVVADLGPIVVFVPLGGLPYNPGLPIVDLDPEPPEEPEEPVPDPSWLWTYSMDETVPAAGVQGEAVPSVQESPAIAYWQYEPAGGYDLDGNAQLVFWAVRDPASQAEPSSRWNARLYSDDVLVASTDPQRGASFLVQPGDLPQEYRIHFGDLALNGTRLRLELDLDATPAGRLVLLDHPETPSRLEIGRPTTTTTAYDAEGRPTVVTDAHGAQTVHAYDGHGQETSITGPDGSRRDSARDPAGRVVESATYDADDADPGSEPIELERSRSFHDEAGRVYRVDRAFFDPATGAALPDGDLFPGDGWATTLYDFDAAGRVVAVIDDNGGVTRFAYDSLGRLVAQTDAVGNRVESIYDAKGNVVNYARVDVDALGTPMMPRTMLFAYDELDRVVRTIDPVGRAQRFGYDSRGNLAWQSDARNPTLVFDDLYGGNVNDHGNRVEFSYDAQDRLVATVRELRAGGEGNSALVGYVNTTQEWDAQGRLARQTDDSGSSTVYAYDSFGRLARSTFADGTNETYEYDARGLLVATTKPDGFVIQQDYDEASRLISRMAGGDWPVAQAFGYDGLGRLIRGTDGDSVLAFGYDSLGNVIHETQNGLAAERRFDGLGNKLGLTHPNGRVVTHEYDALNRLTEVSDPSGIVTSSTYEGVSRLVSQTVGNGVTSAFMYDDAEQLTQMDHALPGFARPLRFGYGYDGNGNRVEELFHHAPEWSKAAAYDSLGRLESMARSNIEGLPMAPNPLEGIVASQQAWMLDGANEWGAFMSLKDGAWVNQTRSHDALHTLDSITVGLASTAYTSDENGNRLAEGDFTYGWDVLNRLREVRDAATDQVVATYHYDALGRRTAKVVGEGTLASDTTRFVYDGSAVIEERDGDGVLLRQFVHGPGVDRPLLMDRNLDGDATATGIGDERLYFLQDGLGSVVGLMDEDGILVEGYLYDAYGSTAVLQPGPSGAVTWTADDVVAETSAFGNPYAFTGQRLDAETGLYYYRARYYDAETGSFLSRDPIGVWGDEYNLGNPYAYVAGNPVTNTDPEGLYCMNVFKKSCRAENGRDSKRDFTALGTAPLAFVPIRQTDWARERVRQEYAEFQNSNVPAPARFGLELLGPPQSRGEAGAFVALSVIPGGGKLGKAVPGAKLIQKSHATAWLDDLAEQFVRHQKDFLDTTSWQLGKRGAGQRTTVLGARGEFVEEALQSGARYMNTPQKYFETLSRSGKAALNDRFLLNTVARHDNIVLSTVPSRAEGLYARELEWLSTRGVSSTFHAIKWLL